MQSLRLARPRAIMMVGIPGSGKSFFAAQFAELFQAPYIDSLALEALAQDSAAAGTLISLVMGEVSKCGQTFVFEGNSDSRARRTEFFKWARSKGFQPLLIWVQTDKATSLSRTLKGGSLDRTEFADYVRDFSPPHPDERAIVVSGKHTFKSQLKVVLAHLGRENRANTPPPAAPSTAVPPRPTARPVVVR
jgi:hypothetical protein